MNTINIVKLLRPHQWLKNLFAFLPLFFDGYLLNPDYLFPTLAVFVTFCCMASGIYCMNDIHDRQFDKLHPYKRKRPVASGAISVRNACIILSFCLLATFVMLVICNNSKLYVIMSFYLTINILYCFVLKQIAIVDAIIIAVGYILRILAGGVVTGSYLSHWIILMTFLLSLFLAFAKRMEEAVLYEKHGIKGRNNIAEYSVPFINQSLSILASVTMVCYIMYTVSEEIILRFRSPYLCLTSVFVLSGLLRYLLLVMRNKSGSPTRILLKDHFIQVCILLWITVYFYIIYGGGKNV